MSEPEKGHDLDAGVFDLDKWIDEIERPSVVVELYPHEDDYRRRVEEIEAQIPAAEKAGDERGIDDPSPEALLAQLDELRRERAARTLRVRVRQLTDAETRLAAMAAYKAGVKSEFGNVMWGLAAATVAPDYHGPLDVADVPTHFTGPQLVRLHQRDRSGQAMVTQLLNAVNGLMEGLPVPSSPER